MASTLYHAFGDSPAEELMAISIEPIGFVRAPSSAGGDEGWGAVTSELHVHEQLAPGLAGLEQFSHILVVYWMHQSSFAPEDLVRRPRGRADMPELGIFAQRAKHRPNPIGLTAVRLLERRGALLRVAGLDAVDGSPLLDIKPYFPPFDRVEKPEVPEWVDRLMAGYF
jgi:tRNA-Thr(GGU) m(6)t(6)A37 methyltransferase TsaA